MNPLLQQFISEARDFLQGIAENLMQLEKAPQDAAVMSELFRFVHTLKGNSGLFEFPEMTRVLHAGEDLLDDVRHARTAYSQNLADRLLDAMDFVGMLLDEIEATGLISAHFAQDSVRLTESLRQLIMTAPQATTTELPESTSKTPLLAAQPTEISLAQAEQTSSGWLAKLPEAIRMDAYRLAQSGQTLHTLTYSPSEECFFQGEDPFYQARQTPGLLWGSIIARAPWPKLADMDAYRCQLDFHILSAASAVELTDYYRYMADYLSLAPLANLELLSPSGTPNSAPLQQDISAAAPGNPTEEQPAATPQDLDAEAYALIDLQWQILQLPIKEAWQLGRMQAAATALLNCLRAAGTDYALNDLLAATEQAVSQAQPAPLLDWLAQNPSLLATIESARQLLNSEASVPELTPTAPSQTQLPLDTKPAGDTPPLSKQAPIAEPKAADPDADIKFGRRAEDHISNAKSLKVDQAKIDRLMNLIGEMVVSKNALPYLAARAETVFGSRELSREIKTQYAVINRIAEEMQDAIMQVRMLPVSFVFQRFSRLVRDTSRKLGKDVKLILEGEDTEADKNIIEALGDPLVHIIRNSLDHGFELPEVRKAAGKPATGVLLIRASQESDRVLIEIIDDGKGIDPELVKRKAYEKGLIDEATLERLSDHEAINLVFAPGFSTAEVVSDLSGRGVGMDVVRTAIEKVNGHISLESEPGKGARIRLSLPLSIAVTNVMIVASAGQVYGVPMDSVVETVRIPRLDFRSIKHSLATVLRGRIIPIKAMNTLLAIDAAPQANADDELAVLVVRLGEEAVGLLVDDFHETVEIILKPMTGVLASLSAFAGSALMGDGSVLLVLDVKELLL